jgi:chemotaxis protein CheX
MDTRLLTAFTENLTTTFMKMAEIQIMPVGEIYKENSDISSLGVTCIVSFAGKMKGRLLLDMESGLAIQIAKNIIGEDFDNPKDDMVLAAISEINNIISGGAITLINNVFLLSLRLSPPIVFAGKGVVISIPKINSMSNIYTTKYGNLKVNIAFEGGGFDGC